MKRNLLYYLYPKKWSIWPWHIATLLRYKDVWNGRKILIVAEDQHTETDKKLLPVIAPLGAEIHRVPNHPHLGETRYFVEKLGILESLNPEEATFYAHSKAVTRQGPWLAGATMWAKAMYTLNLENIAAVERMLTLYSAVGCFRHFLPHAGSRWCYAGTYFWLKHSSIFSRSWRDIEQSRFGVEGYPGRHLSWGEMGTFTPDNVGPVWLYNGGVTDASIEAWKSNWGGNMHGSVMAYLRRMVTRGEVQGKDVLEVGSYNVNGTPRDVFIPFSPKQYLGVDQGAGPGVDRVLEASNLTLALGENAFDVVISTEMLEHAQHWRQAVSNLKAVTKPGGLLFVTTRGPGFPYHGFPHDHWRFTVEDFKRIFGDMEILDVSKDPEAPGVFLKCRKPVGFRPVDLSKIHVVPAPAPPSPGPALAAPAAPQAAPKAASVVAGAAVVMGPSRPNPTGPGPVGPSVTPMKH
jgi:SAM-dependent methyltransferase